jgi:hypothetical protein
VSHLHGATLGPGESDHFRLMCSTTWQTTAVNARAAFDSWLHEATAGTITEPVNCLHILIAIRFSAALAAAAVSWLPTPHLQFHIRMPGGRRIWIEDVPTYRCDWTRRPTPAVPDTDIRPALRTLEELASRVRWAGCECLYWQRWIAAPGTAHPRVCGCVCHR